MSLSNTYWLEETPDLLHNHSCSYDIELGRVRAVAFIRRKYLQQVLADPASIAVWQLGIDSGDIAIVPLATGTFEPGEPAKLKGYGRRLSTRGKREMTLSFSDPFYKNNYAFYNLIHQHTDLVPAYKTGTLLHIGDSPADIIAGDPVEEDVDSEVVWQVTCKMRSHNLPVKVEAGSLESLFYSSGSGSFSQSASGSGGGTTIITSMLVPIERFKVGAAGAPMNEGGTIYTNAALVNKRVLVFANGVKFPELPDGFQRYITKHIGGNQIIFSSGVNQDEIIEIYTHT